jgi:hypothetical protein
VGNCSRQVETVVKLCDSKKLAEIGRGVDDVKRDMAQLKNLIVGFMRAQFQSAKCKFVFLVCALTVPQLNHAIL